MKIRTQRRYARVGDLASISVVQARGVTDAPPCATRAAKPALAYGLTPPTPEPNARVNPTTKPRRCR